MGDSGYKGRVYLAHSEEWGFRFYENASELKVVKDEELPALS